MKKFKNADAFRAAFPRTLPVMAGYEVLGFGFGLLLQSKGYSSWWAILMSLTIYAGSMQYVAVDLLSTGAGFLSTALMTFMINARHLFYGISMLEPYRDTGKVKPYIIFGLTDETYSLVCSGEVPDGVEKSAFYFWTSILNQSYWVTGSALGALFGTALAINTKGVDFSMTALFTVIFTDNFLNKNSRLPAIIGLCVSFVCLMIFGASNFLIPSMIFITIALMLFRNVLSKERRREHDQHNT
ncbi:MAG: AzlC family ABC transporter permease [Clostridiales bacterium]|nr:AzlC family ABC transporter permease [Candidatus Blautia equi]